ncbi:hypothetical protein DEO72_LG8g2456 [Vigna unguiculata]|uniref:Uncharacterized protein n=1 Tax=Vigna unguiculata TaxID=3917 RepID=A0A4D6MSC8_VIGUN|nr:hypothetical protein DEO72_LG8g2456 [Vigna unguiculata]
MNESILENKAHTDSGGLHNKCKAQFSCPKALRAALELLGRRAGPKDKATQGSTVFSVRIQLDFVLSSPLSLFLEVVCAPLFGCQGFQLACPVASTGFLTSSEHVSPRRDYREPAWVFLREVSPGRRVPFWVSHILAQARRTRLSERAQEATVPLFEPSPRRMGARLSETLQPEQGARRGSALCDYFLGLNVRNSLMSLGETFRVVLQWSGRNSMAPISGCLW